LKRYFLKLAYDGTNYSGWQIQPKVTTVQGTLEDALRILVKDFRALIGCGRTDTGVHAREYYAHFDTTLPLRDDFLYKLNAILPLDIAVSECFKVDGQLHARFSAEYREYKYYMHFEKSPFQNAYSVFHVKALDISLMNEGARYLLGEKDFASFSKSNTQVKTNICHVSKAIWEPSAEGIVFTIGANRFLRNMVRAIVGTMMPIGEGEKAPSYVEEVIAAKDRAMAGKSAHPQGLFLNHISYPFLDGSNHR
jgi:tRNA pseudouridine38-40 synthase